jgi:hypothetical protein
MIDGVGSKPFSAHLPCRLYFHQPENSYVEDIIASLYDSTTRLQRSVVEEEINAWTTTNFDPKQQYKEQAEVTFTPQSPAANNNFKKDNFSNPRQDQKPQRDRRDRKDDRSEYKSEKRDFSNQGNNQTNNQVKPKSEPSLLGDLIQKAMSEKAFQEPATPTVKEVSTDSQSLRDVLKLAKGGANDLKATRQTAKSTAKNLHFIRTNSSKMIDSQKNLPDTVLKSLFDL